MAFCPNCGAQAEGRFCAACGTTLGGAAPGAQGGPPPSFQQQPYQQGSQQQGPQANAQAGLPENAASALCYLLGLITGVLFLAIAPYSQNPRVKFHAFQSIFLNVAWIAFWIVSMFLAYLLPTLLVVLFGLLQLVISLGIILLWLFMMWKTYNGERVELPIVGPLAAQQAGR